MSITYIERHPLLYQKQEFKAKGNYGPKSINTVHTDEITAVTA